MKLLALDPSLTSTGWMAFDLTRLVPVAAGVIRTKAPKPAEKKHATMAALDAARGTHIRRELLRVMSEHNITIAAQEGAAGSKSAKVAAGLARAQQACVDAIYEALDGMPLFVTQQAVKKTAAGSLSASKDDVEAGVRARFPMADWDALLKGYPRGQHEHIFDAGAVGWTVWDHPAVSSLRNLALRASPGGGHVA